MRQSQQLSGRSSIAANLTMGLATGGNLRRRPSQGKDEDDDAQEKQGTEDGDGLARPNEDSTSGDPRAEEKAASKLTKQPPDRRPKPPVGVAEDEPPGEKRALERPGGKPDIGLEDAQDNRRPRLPEEDGKKDDGPGDAQNNNHVEVDDEEDVYS